MKRNPLVSVIIPAYNAECYIDEALRSILVQSYQHIEIIVVNDGSTDNTSQRVAAFGNRVSYYQQPNSGGYPGIPRNTGIKHCAGTYVCFLDADDIMLPDKVQQQINFLDSHPDVGLVFTDYRNFTTEGPAQLSHFQTCPRLQVKLGNRPWLVLPGKEAKAHLIHENLGLPSTLMIRREVLNTVGGFTSEFQIGEDFHFYYQAAHRWPIAVINRIGTMRRLHDGNITSNSLRMLHNYIESRTVLRDSERNAGNIKLFNEALRFAELTLARTYTDRKEFVKALGHNWRALSRFPPGSLHQLLATLRSFVRTLAFAARLKHSPGN